MRREAIRLWRLLITFPGVLSRLRGFGGVRPDSTTPVLRCSQLTLAERWLNPVGSKCALHAGKWGCTDLVDLPVAYNYHFRRSLATAL